MMRDVAYACSMYGYVCLLYFGVDIPNFRLSDYCSEPCHVSMFSFYSIVLHATRAYACVPGANGIRMDANTTKWV